jgi:hypothetical protein
MNDSDNLELSSNTPPTQHYRHFTLSTFVLFMGSPSSLSGLLTHTCFRTRGGCMSTAEKSSTRSARSSCQPNTQKPCNAERDYQDPYTCSIRLSAEYTNADLGHGEYKLSPLVPVNIRWTTLHPIKNAEANH